VQDYKAKIYEYYFTKRVGRTAPASLVELEKRKPFYNNVIKNHFPADRESSVVDLGCGYGAFLHFMQQSGYFNTSGIDTSAEMVAEAEKLGINNVHQGNVVEFLRHQPDESIDVLTAIDLIEHFPKEELFDLVSQFQRVLKPGGRVITHQPNAEGVFGNAILYGDFTHEQAFTRVSIAQIFLRNGFTSISSFEDKPLRFSMKSRIRRLLWDWLVRPFYLFLVAVESGGSDKDIIFTKNFLSVAVK
jgi:SAM-dependent methyltransferase